MKNFVQPGNTLDLIAPAALTSGQPVLIGSIFGVAVTDAASGDTVAVDIEGVFELAKVTTDAIAAGDKLYWDSAAAKLTKTPGTGSKPLVGFAVAAAGNGVTTVCVAIEWTGASGPA
jgi:predicted RecA/RadA family phage recombinase